MSLSAKSSNRVRSSYESSTCCYAVAEVIKQRHAVRLGPHAHRARSSDMAVIGLDVRLAVEDYADLLSRELHAQRVPDVPGHRRIHVFDRVAPSVRRVVERYVVLERVGARNVVVVAVLPAPYHPACLILPALERLELHLDVAVGERRIGSDAPGEGSAAGLLEHVGPARRGSVGFDRPFGRAATGDARAPASGQRARRVAVE